jgi:RimJ/RimL family protein N-acetyltransferase
MNRNPLRGRHGSPERQAPDGEYQRMSQSFPKGHQSVLPDLRTKRLLLEPLDKRHLRQFVAVAGSRSIADTTISVPHPLTEDEGFLWIQRAISEDTEGRAAHFAVTIAPDAESLVGYVGIKGIDREHEEGELSFWLEDRHAGQGLMTEGAAAVVRFAFSALGLNRICAYHMVRNSASARILTKLGFQQEGRLRQRVRKWGVYEDVLLWAKLRSDD